MPEDRKVFYAIGAVIVNSAQSQDKVTTVALTTISEIDTVNPTDTTKHIEIDFSKRAGHCPWEAVEIDDLGVFDNGELIPPSRNYEQPNMINILTVGPKSPGCPSLGGIYLEEKKFTRERSKFDPGGDRWPLPPFRPYQMMSSRYKSPARRYHGFHATVVDKQLPFLRLRVEGRRRKTLWVHIDNRDECDDPAQLGLGAAVKPISRDSAVGDEGPVFLSLTTCASLYILGPKQPPGGGVVMPNFGRLLVELSRLIADEGE